MTRAVLAGRFGRIVAVVVLLGVLVWLRDPPFAGRVTSGLRSWEQDPDGTRFRWTSGRASFFVLSAAQAVDLPLRARALAPDFLPVFVEIAVDGRAVDRLRLDDEQWVTRRLRLGALRTTRRFRRVDLRVNRVWSERFLGVQLGEVVTRVTPDTPPR